MKVFFANSYLEGCWYVRCLIPLRAGGWWGDRTSIRADRIEPDMKAKAVTEADIVVFHRPNDDRSIKAAKMLKQLGKKIVCDNDDSYHGVEMTKFGDKLKVVAGALDDFVKYADMVTCSTEFLAAEYRKLNPNVVVLPNCVDLFDWPDEPQRNSRENYGDEWVDRIVKLHPGEKMPWEKVRIGITGSVAITNDMDNFKPIIQELSKREDIQLVLFSLPPKSEHTKEMVQKIYAEDYKFWESINVEWQPFVMMDKYIETLDDLKLDIMVIPRNDDYFNRAKSNIKFLEASCLRVPCIAQGFHDNMSPYQVDPDDAKHMVIVTDNSRWMEEINKLVKDKELRRSMGDAAHDYVLDKYTIEKNIWRWEECYKNLLNAQPTTHNSGSEVDKRKNKVGDEPT